MDSVCSETEKVAGTRHVCDIGRIRISYPGASASRYASPKAAH